LYEADSTEPEAARLSQSRLNARHPMPREVVTDRKEIRVNIFAKRIAKITLGELIPSLRKNQETALKGRTQRPLDA
jgi:hypothetical protein